MNRRELYHDYLCWRAMTMKNQVLNIAFSPCPLKWSQELLAQTDMTATVCDTRSQLPKISADHKIILIHLDALRNFELAIIIQLRNQMPHAILIGWITSNSLPDELALRLITHGLNALISDAYTPKEFLTVINDCLSHALHVNHFFSRAMLHEYQRRHDITSLNDREQDAIRLRREGKTAVEIADQLCVSKKTIDQLFWKIYRRTGHRNFQELCHTLQHERKNLVQELVGATDPFPATNSLK